MSSFQIGCMNAIQAIHLWRKGHWSTLQNLNPGDTVMHIPAADVPTFMHPIWKLDITTYTGNNLSFVRMTSMSDRNGQRRVRVVPYNDWTAGLV